MMNLVWHVMLVVVSTFAVTAVESLRPELDVGGATPQQLRQLLRRLPEGIERDYVDAALVELLEARRGASRVDSYTNSVPSPQAVASRLGPPPEEALEFAADHHYTQNLSLSRAQLAKRVHELVAALEAERLAPAFDVAYCVVGQERGFSSPVVYESLRRNVMRALNESLADWHAQHPPPEPSLLHHRPRRRLSSDKSEARRAKRRRDRAAAWATLTGGGGGRDEKKESVAAAKSIAAKNDPYLSSALHGSSETRSDLDVSSQSTTSSRSHASSDSASSSDAASTTISATASSSNSGGVRGDVFVYVKVDGTEVTEARRAARRIGAGADRVGIVRKAALRDAHWLASQQGQNPDCPFTQQGDVLKRKFAVVSFDQKRCFELVRDAEEMRGGKRYTHVMKLRTDQQVCTPLSAATLAPALPRPRPRGEPAPRAQRPAIVKQRDHWAFVPRQWADVYFNASNEVLGQCHSRNVYDSFPAPPGSQLESDVSHASGTPDENAPFSASQAMNSAVSSISTTSSSAPSKSTTRRCHWHSRNHPKDVPNECLLDHWLASNGVPFVEVMVPTCIRKKKSAVAGEPCPAISFNRSRKADTRNC